MKVVLLGYMASGKSTIGKKLALEINRSFIDLDSYIEQQEGKSVSEIFNTRGEIYFRLQEHIYLKELLNNSDSFILSLGGGTPCYSNNMELLKANKNIDSLYLKASIKTLLSRLKDQKNERPLVANLSEEALKEFIAKHLFERSFYYEQAKHTLKIDGKEIDKIVSDIKKLLC